MSYKISVVESQRPPGDPKQAIAEISEAVGIGELLVRHPPADRPAAGVLIFLEWDAQKAEGAKIERFGQLPVYLAPILRPPRAQEPRVVVVSAQFYQFQSVCVAWVMARLSTPTHVTRERCIAYLRRLAEALSPRRAAAWFVSKEGRR